MPKHPLKYKMSCQGFFCGFKWKLFGTWLLWCEYGGQRLSIPVGGRLKDRRAKSSVWTHPGAAQQGSLAEGLQTYAADTYANKILNILWVVYLFLWWYTHANVLSTNNWLIMSIDIVSMLLLPLQWRLKPSLAVSAMLLLPPSCPQLRLTWYYSLPLQCIAPNCFASSSLLHHRHHFYLWRISDIGQITF